MPFVCCWFLVEHFSAGICYLQCESVANGAESAGSFEGEISFSAQRLAEHVIGRWEVRLKEAMADGRQCELFENQTPNLGADDLIADFSPFVHICFDSRNSNPWNTAKSVQIPLWDESSLGLDIEYKYTQMKWIEFKWSSCKVSIGYFELKSYKGL